MFTDSYPVHYCGIDRLKVRPDLIETHLFRFKADNNQAYIIRAELHSNNVYAVKFYLKNHRNSEFKYSFTTNLGTPTKIIATCLRVMVNLYRRDETTSFVIVGANSIGEAMLNTKRYRIYKAIFRRFFSTSTFDHIEYPIKSAYMLVNLAALEEDHLLDKKIVQMLVQ